MDVSVDGPLRQKGFELACVSFEPVAGGCAPFRDIALWASDAHPCFVLGAVRRCSRSGWQSPWTRCT